nr:retrovirus-related Pol polyprotein from transposon TNT 1-94 [Tanacetum cinerariifolium]
MIKVKENALDVEIRIISSENVQSRQEAIIKELLLEEHGVIVAKMNYLTKFDPKSYEGVFLGYSQNSKSYIILNKQTMKVKESLNVTFDETPPPPKTSPLEDDDLVEEQAIEDPKTCHLEAVKRIFRYIKGTMHLGLWYHKGSGIETIVYADSDHAGDYVDRKSTSGICTFMRCCLTSWFSKKQTAFTISTNEAEYVSTGKACQQALWMKQALKDYSIMLDVIIMCDDKGAIDLSKNLVQYSRTKHIEIRHHFLRDNVQKGNISIEKVSSKDNIADILTKPFKPGSENHPLMLNKENYVPWSSCLLRYAKSRPNGKLIHNSIINGPYVKRMIPKPSDPNREVPTILLGLPEDIYAAVDSCETAQEIWLHVQQMMKGSDIGIQEKKAKLFNEWERFTFTDGESIESYYHCFLKLMNDLKRNKHFPEKIANYTQLYDFLKYKQKEVDDLKAERLARTQDPLALMATSNNPYTFPVLHQDQPSFNQNYMQRPMPNPEDICETDADGWRNQVIQNAIQYPRIQNVGNQNGLIVVPGNANQNPNGNGNLVAAHAEGNATGHNGNQIRCYNCRELGHFARNYTVRPRRRDAAYLQTQLLVAQKEEARIQLQAEEFDLMAAATDLDEIKEVNANCILMANLQQASTSGTQTDKAPVNDSDGSVEVHNYENCYDNEIFNMFTQEKQYTELLEPIPEPHQVPQNDNNVISEKLENENVELVFQILNYAKENAHLKTTYKNLFNSISVTRTQTKTIIDSLQNKLHDTIYENAKLRAQLFDKVSDQKDTACGTSANTKFAKQSILGKPPRSNTKNDRVPSASKSSYSKNKEDEVEAYHRKLLLSKNKKHMTSKCNNVKLATQNVKSKVVCAMCKQCLIFVNHDACLLNYVNDMTSREGVDLLKGNRTTNLYTINLHEMASASPICLMARASSTKSWLWHQRLSHLNFDTINDLEKNDLFFGLPKFKYHKEHLCPSCEQGKSKRASYPTKPVPNSRQRLHLLHMDLCGPIRITSINGKRYVLVIVDEYSRYTWVHFLRSKDEASEVIKTFLKRITVLLQSHVIIIRINNGTEFKNQVLKEYLDSVGISHQVSSVRTPQQNGVVERRNQMLVEAARTMLFFLMHCYSYGLKRLLLRVLLKTAPSFTNDREDIEKLGAKGDIGFFIGYSADSYAYRVFNRRTKKIIKTMNVTFVELSLMTFEQRSSKPELQSMTSRQISSGLDLTYAPSTITTQQPTEEFSDDTTPSVARKFLNEVKSTIVTIQHVVIQRMTLDTHSWSSSAHQELHKIVKDEIFPIVNQVDARVQNLEIKFLKQAAKFVGDFKSLTKEADESLAKHKALELEIKRLLRAVDWYKKCEQSKFDKISYDKAYNDMQQKIERLQAQLGDLKGKSKDTSCVPDTLNPLSQKLENENVELEFQPPPTPANPSLPPLATTWIHHIITSPFAATPPPKITPPSVTITPHHHATIASPFPAVVSVVAGCRWRIGHQSHGEPHIEPPEILFSCLVFHAWWLHRLYYKIFNLVVDLVMVNVELGFPTAKSPSWWRSDDGTATTAA